MDIGVAGTARHHGAKRRAVQRRLGQAFKRLLFTTLLFPGLSTAQTAPDDEVIFALDFTRLENIEPRDWMRVQAFELQRHADDPDHIEFQHYDERLHVRAKKPSFGLAIREVEVPGATRLRLHWGVSDFPEGASYQHGVDNEAIMVYVFFGKERLDSGELFVPDSPYFVGFYLCPAGVDADELEHPYAGHHYRKTGRYVCVDHPREGEAVVSEVNLDAEFAASFGIDSMPEVSAISIEIDTTDSENDGHAAAFLQRLEFLD